MVFGTFDLIHPGHIDFFKQARRLAKNVFLIVSVARDVNVSKIKLHNPRQSEYKRAKALKKIWLVDKVVLGGKKDYLPHILKERPDIIALGYDQKAYTQNLKKKLESNGLKIIVRRLKSFKPKLYKSGKIFSALEKISKKSKIVL